MQCVTIEILGTKYKIERVANGCDKDLNDGVCGYCAFDDHKIAILSLKTLDSWKDESDTAIAWKEKETLLHEIIHAFLHESGLAENSVGVDHWAMNEEMVDWFARQFDKIAEAYSNSCLIFLGDKHV